MNKAHQSSKSELKALDILMDVWCADPYKESTNVVLPPAKAKLLDLALSCLIEKDKCEDCGVTFGEDDKHIRFADSFRCPKSDELTGEPTNYAINAVIDTIEQNIRAKFK